jgi:hypothetical protein
MAYVAVEKPDGSHSIGSAFHVGECVFVTARHVVEGNKILVIKITESIAIDIREYLSRMYGKPATDEQVRDYDTATAHQDGTPSMWRHFHPPLEFASGPYFSTDRRLDVAAFKVKELHPNTKHVKLGAHFDDWVYRAEWRLLNAIVLGYPPIPMTDSPTLIAAKAEIHTPVVVRDSRAVHFILSAMPRGGFSGGVAIYEDGTALGVITTSLGMNHEPEQLGFFAVLSIEGIVGCLIANRIYPEVQREFYKSILGLDPIKIFEPLYQTDEKRK